VRPTLVVGPGDVLTNNIAWFLRRFPVFLLPRGGTGRLQPVMLSETARIVADALAGGEGVEVDAAGPEVWSFGDYVRLIARACGVRRWFLDVPQAWTLLALNVAGVFLRDTVLTREELLGLQQELLVSHAPPLGSESVGEWLQAHGHDLGRTYVNDLARHFGSRRSDPITPS
jgi:uncharacterized protein YbjT (DUF2867 family)